MKRVKLNIVLCMVLWVNYIHAAAISWGTSGGQWLYQNDTTSLITGGTSLSSGGYMELLNIGTDTAYDTTDYNTYPVLGVPIWVGRGYGSNRDGRGYILGTTVSIGLYDNVVIRFFEQPGPSGRPTSGYYGVSSVFTYTNPYHNDTQDMFITSHTDATFAVPVPEPSTMALLASGMGVLAIRRRRKQK
jgi:hypothetical protein